MLIGGTVKRWNSWTAERLNGETVEGIKPDDWWNSWTKKQLNCGTVESVNGWGGEPVERLTD